MVREHVGDQGEVGERNHADLFLKCRAFITLHDGVLF
jgi:hypothetical protein